MTWVHKPSKTLMIKGARYRIPEALGVGYSFFLPCLKHKATFAAVTKAYSKEGYKFTWADRIEDGMLGIRVWRVL